MESRKRIIRQHIKSALQKTLLPLCYKLSKKKDIDKKLVILADLNSVSAPESMELIKAELQSRGYKVREMYCDLSSCGMVSGLKYMMSFMKAYANAMAVFICNYFVPVTSCKKREETTVVQLWHSCGALKKFGYDSEEDISSHFKGSVTRNFDLITVSSKECVKAFVSAFRLKEDIVKPLGVSRTDVFFDESYNEQCRREFFERYPDYKGKKIVLYAPTFRGNALDCHCVGEEYAAELEKKLADELAACSDKDAFIAKAVEYILGTYANDSFDKYYENNKKSLDDADKPDDAKLAADKAAMVKEIGEKVKDSTKELTEHGDTNSYTKVLDKVSSSLLTDVQNAYDAINKTSSVSYSDPADKDASDSTKWLFDADRKAGDKTVISNEAEKKSTYTAYFMEATAHRDETVTKNVGHILFKTTTYETAEKAKEKAEEILAKYKEGEQTKDAFEALANEYTEDSSVFYENVTKDYMVKEFDAWTFDSSRKAGDVDIVETTHGAHVMYFVGDGEIAWKVTAKNGVFGEKYEAWYETEKNSVGVTFSDSTMKTLG